MNHHRTREDCLAIIDKCRDKYERHGPSSVYDYALKLGIESTAMCVACDAMVPHLLGQCLLCGSSVPVREEPGPTILRHDLVLKETVTGAIQWLCKIPFTPFGPGFGLDDDLAHHGNAHLAINAAYLMYCSWRVKQLLGEHIAWHVYYVATVVEEARSAGPDCACFTALADMALEDATADERFSVDDLPEEFRILADDSIKRLGLES